MMTNTAQKARIFYDSTVRGVSLPEQIKDCQDEFLFCLNKTGGVDIDWIASLARVSVEQAESELTGRILWTPEGHWEISEKYLAGNVVEKLRTAQALVALEPRLKQTMEALFHLDDHLRSGQPPIFRPDTDRRHQSHHL